MEKWRMDSSLCKGCGLCVEFCKREAIGMSDELNVVGYYLPRLGGKNECNGCGICAEMCPEVAISIYRPKKKKKSSEKESKGGQSNA